MKHFKIGRQEERVTPCAIFYGKCLVILYLSSSPYFTLSGRPKMVEGVINKNEFLYFPPFWCR